MKFHFPITKKKCKKCIIFSSKNSVSCLQFDGSVSRMEGGGWAVEPKEAGLFSADDLLKVHEQQIFILLPK